jgi:hypothetical protein
MKKIKSLFMRDYKGTRQVYDELVPGSEWVTLGEGVPTRKFDGTACMVKEGVIYKRYDVKKGRPAPEVGIPCEDKPNEHTGHWPWWIPVGNGPEDKYFNEAFRGDEEDGTYELVGPKINGNRGGWPEHQLLKHGSVVLTDAPTDFHGLREWFRGHDIEGIVWHHPDGRMVKIKKKDFGLKW